jgi:hypothetical protein
MKLKIGKISMIFFKEKSSRQASSKFWKLPAIFGRFQATKEKFYRAPRGSDLRFIYGIKREMLQIRKHVVILDELIKDWQVLKENE